MNLRGIRLSGVGSNIARGVAMLKHRVRLISIHFSTPTDNFHTKDNKHFHYFSFIILYCFIIFVFLIKPISFLTSVKVKQEFL